MDCIIKNINHLGLYLEKHKLQQVLNHKEIDLLYCQINRIPINFNQWNIRNMAESGSSIDPSARTVVWNASHKDI